MKFHCHLTILLMFTVLIAACSSITITLTDSWKDPAYQEKIHKVYIVGSTHVNISRYEFENLVSAELKTRGVTALPSFKDGDFPVEVDDQIINERVLANNADSLLRARVVNTFSEQNVYKNALVEVVLFEARTGAPIWSGKYRVRFERRADAILIDLAKAIANDLQKNRLL